MRANGLADVFVEWAGLPPGDPRSVLEIQETGCFDLHGLHWQESFIATERAHRICHYRAPDAESVRIAFRRGGLAIDNAWSGTMLRRGDGGGTGVVIERTFEAPWPDDAERALERAEHEWLRPLGLEPLRVIVPAGRRRILCFCAPAAAARLPAPAWACRHVPSSPSPIPMPGTRRRGRPAPP